MRKNHVWVIESMDKTSKAPKWLPYLAHENLSEEDAERQLGFWKRNGGKHRKFRLKKYEPTRERAK